MNESMKGRRVKLLGVILPAVKLLGVILPASEDPFTDVKPGMEGVVDFVDDTGTVHCTWENGSCLSLLPGIDRWEYIEEER